MGSDDNAVMAIPEDRLSSVNLPSAILPPRDELLPKAESKHLGGIALQDPSQGLQVQVWRAFIATNSTEIKIEAPNHIASVIYTGTDITEVSLAFDQNMRQVFSFVEGGLPKYQFFDVVPQVFVTRAPGDSGGLNVADVNPRVFLDDPRVSQEQANDAILGYVRAGTLYHRRLRDRFLFEIAMVLDPVTAALLPSGVTGLNRIGMGTNNRLHFVVA